jgi:eukaryotic-like serine/threonine-protein kinase
VVADVEREKLEKRLGTVLAGKWKLEKLLGYGGMAAVYQARHKIGTQVAVKIVHPEVARSQELRLRFEQCGTWITPRTVCRSS